MMDDMTEIWVLYSTFSRREEALFVAQALVRERLAACANITGNVQSVYRWEGAVREEAEVAMTAKTRRQNVERAIRRIRELHPYQLPCIVATPIADGFAPFLQWVADETA